MSQHAVAEAMKAFGHSWRQTTVAKTEAAERPLRVNEVEALAHVVGVTVADLLGVDPNPNQEFSAALRQLLYAEDTRQRAEVRKREAEAELEAAAEELEASDLFEREARQRLAAIGAVEVNGKWGLSDG